MPLIQPPAEFIDEPIRPITIGGVEFQRLLRYVLSAPRQDPETGEMTVLLTVQVRHYLTQADGTAGSSAHELVKPYELTFRADNAEAVDVATGELAASRLMQTNEQWLAELEADERTLIQRGDAYRATMHAGPVDMVPQIRAAMRAADGAPYYRFGGRPE
jgi:hypothetical protein